VKIKETDMYEPIKNWFLENGYDVYAEVHRVCDGRADIVAWKKPCAICVEMKVNLSFELLYQAIERKNYFHYVYIAIPKRKTHLPYLAQQIIRKEGIGVLEVDVENNYVYLMIKPKFNRPVFKNDWEKELKEKYKENIGGSNDSHIWTPYKITMHNVKEFLKRRRKENEYEWVSIDEILDYCETHYANPKPSLSKALREIEYDWCEFKKENRKLFFRYKDEPSS
jgi:hypothetical protein